MKILIVNSSQIIFDKAKTRLQDAQGVELLLHAFTGQEALDLVTKHHPDVMLIDKNVKGVEECDLIKLSRQYGQVKLIRYTDSEQAADDLFKA